MIRAHRLPLVSAPRAPAAARSPWATFWDDRQATAQKVLLLAACALIIALLEAPW